MFSFARPTDDAIRDYVAQQAGQPFSYDDVGCTRNQPSLRRGWNLDHYRVLLGRGREVFDRARQAIDRWEMFPREVTTLCWPQSPREGLTVAVLYRAKPVRLWLLFPARVVYVTSESVTIDGEVWERYGFAYGTLTDHPERGEERFLALWNRNDDCVYYDLLAFSQPAHWLARIGYPFARYEQARFRRLSGRAMQVAVAHH